VIVFSGVSVGFLAVITIPFHIVSIIAFHGIIVIPFHNVFLLSFQRMILLCDILTIRWYSLPIEYKYTRLHSVIFQKII
jgi:hypothetical protein